MVEHGFTVSSSQYLSAVWRRWMHLSDYLMKTSVLQSTTELVLDLLYLCQRFHFKF
ncbi:hypothetical protein Ccrd_012986 [Cynara cardunculus var. scolymus]|uniref:Uncharacterized protein n=1 Tax=Cynara cardunculus var. scolymus TaxID=59895 RepID=A0A118K572_CYNCS|nr:hypothetical protein Ccrd_012986 [Cynara cardunculus var. scolymus]